MNIVRTDFAASPVFWRSGLSRSSTLILVNAARNPSGFRTGNYVDILSIDLQFGHTR